MAWVEEEWDRVAFLTCSNNDAMDCALEKSFVASSRKSPTFTTRVFGIGVQGSSVRCGLELQVPGLMRAD